VLVLVLVPALPLFGTIPFSFWKSGGATFSHGTSTRTYSSDGDSNGVCYFIGTNYSVGGWTNPQSVSLPVTVTASGILGGSEEQPIALTDRVASHVYTTNVANSWFKFDFGNYGGTARTLVVTAYTFRSRTGFTGDFPTQWKLEGSNDNSSWTVIDGPRSVSITTQNQWLTTAVAGQVTGYRYLKWTSTAASTGSNNYFVSGEMEFYGTFTY
jgi:hypothetical protein